MLNMVFCQSSGPKLSDSLHFPLSLVFYLKTLNLNRCSCDIYILNLPSPSEAALSMLLGYSEYVRQLPNISKCLPHHQASEDTLPQSEERISKSRKKWLKSTVSDGRTKFKGQTIKQWQGGLLQ